MFFTCLTKKKIKQLSLLFLLFFSIPAFAQTGCIIVYNATSYGNRIYTKSLGTFVTCNGYSNVEQFDPAVYTDFDANCTVTPNPLSLVISSDYRNCIVSFSCGVKQTFVVDNCPLDDYAWLAMLLTGSMAIVLLKRGVAKASL